jgi:hypothetical protein
VQSPHGPLWHFRRQLWTIQERTPSQRLPHIGMRSVQRARDQTSDVFLPHAQRCGSVGINVHPKHSPGWHARRQRCKPHANNLLHGSAHEKNSPRPSPLSPVPEPHARSAVPAPQKQVWVTGVTHGSQGPEWQTRVQRWLASPQTRALSHTLMHWRGAFSASPQRIWYLCGRKAM